MTILVYEAHFGHEAMRISFNRFENIFIITLLKYLTQLDVNINRWMRAYWGGCRKMFMDQKSISELVSFFQFPSVFICNRRTTSMLFYDVCIGGKSPIFKLWKISFIISIAIYFLFYMEIVGVFFSPKHCRSRCQQRVFVCFLCANH